MKQVVKIYSIVLICMLLGHGIGSFVMQDYEMSNLKWFIYTISVVAISEHGIRENIFNQDD